MAENLTNEVVDEVSMGMQNLSLKASDYEKTGSEKQFSQELSAKKKEHEISASTTIGADEAKDSEVDSPETEIQPVQGRVFVGGISWRTTDRELREYFGKFGAIKDCLVCKDQWTGKSRGFGFLSFEDPEVAEMLISKTHTIGGRTVQVKNAVPKSNNVSHPKAPRIPAGQNRTKLFVGGLHRSVNNKEFRAYFEAYGKLTDAFIMYNMQSKRSRGFGFVTFVSQESAHNCLCKEHTIRGKAVELKVAIPREVIGSPRHKRRMRSGHYYQQQQQQHPQQHAKYDGGWPNDLHSTAGAVPYGHGHLLPATAPMMPPPLLTPTSEASTMGGMVPQQSTPAAAVNPHLGTYDQWVPSVMGVGRLAAGMGAGMYSPQDLYVYSGMPPPHGMAANPYGYGYHVPMYGPYREAPVTYDPAAATIYDPGPGGFSMPPPSSSQSSAGVPPPNAATPPPNTETPTTPNVEIPSYPENPTTDTPEI